MTTDDNIADDTGADGKTTDDIVPDHTFSPLRTIKSTKNTRKITTSR